MLKSDEEIFSAENVRVGDRRHDPEFEKIGNVGQQP